MQRFRVFFSSVLVLMHIAIAGCNKPSLNERLYQSARDGDIQIVKDCLDNNADPLYQHFLKHSDNNEAVETPFHAACRGGHTEIVQEFLDIGVDPNTNDVRGISSVAIAINASPLVNEEKTLAVVKGLVMAGADRKEQGARDPFCIAVTLQRYSVAQYLIEAGFSVEEEVNGETALEKMIKHFPSSPEQVQFAGLILERMPNCSSKLARTSKTKVLDAGWNPVLLEVQAKISKCDLEK